MRWTFDILAQFERAELNTLDFGVISYCRSSVDPVYYWDIYRGAKRLRLGYTNRELLDWLNIHEATPVEGQCFIMVLI